jgi:hypothetical protein
LFPYSDSQRNNKIANSTLAAESMACSSAVDELDYTNALWSEMSESIIGLQDWCHRKFDKASDRCHEQRDGIVTIDARCLYDSISGCGTKQPQCKRTALEVAVINESTTDSNHKLK